MALEDFGTETRTDLAIPTGATPELELSKGFGDDELYKATKTQWALCGTEEYVGIQKTQKTLHSGVYRPMHRNGEVILCRTNINVDDLIEFPDSISDGIIKEIGDFWNKESLFKKYGFLHRRGYLLYGPAGGGKTSVLQQIMKKIIDRKGLVFSV